MGGDDREEGQPKEDAEAPVPLDVIPLHSTNLLTVLDETGVVRYESPSIERIYGFDQDELIGEQVAEYFHPADRADVVEAFGRVVTADEYTVESVEYRHETADGSYRWVESVASSDSTPSGQYVVNTRDVSARKAREQELERTNERLDRFSKALSHDLRTPLSVATGRLDLAMDECDSDHLGAVETALERMDVLIENLRSLAHDGGESGEPEPVDLASLGESCVSTVAPDRATLETAVERPIMADANRTRRLLENLMRNAVVHGDEAPTITVAALPDASGFYVEDDGQGIEPDRREAVFETGYSTARGGSGFGLTVVRDIAAAHDWEVELTSGEDGGARFEFTGVEFA